jgi:TatA/E family protein of Tat protein translocase
MLGTPDVLLILGLALVIFGPKKLPDLAKALGKAMREFKSATEDLKGNFHEEIQELSSIKGNIKGTILREIDRATEPKDSGKKALGYEVTAVASAEKAAGGSGGIAGSDGGLTSASETPPENTEKAAPK